MNPKDKVPVIVLLTPKWLITTGKIIQKISTFLAVKFGVWLFTKTLRYPTPKRELTMYNQSNKEILKLNGFSEKIVAYHYGNGQKKILLVHGWAGSGTQLSKIAEQLISTEYSIVSFDAPGHGKAPGRNSMLPHFVAAIKQLEDAYGPFEFAIGHSLGGMALLRAVREGLKIKKLVTIGTANRITKILDDFAKNMELSPMVAKGMKTYFDHSYGNDIDELSGAMSARYTKIPTLIIHDKDDIDVPVEAAYEIHQELFQGTLFLTEGLGHRKILGSSEVSNKIINFIKKKDHEKHRSIADTH